MRTGVCTAVRAAGVRAVKGGESMSETYFACCGGCLIFLVALITITEILSPSISNYINAKAAALRVLTKELRKEKAHASDSRGEGA